MNLGTVTISKKGLIRAPDELIEKLKLNKKIDAICFIWDKETKKVWIKVLKGDG